MTHSPLGILSSLKSTALLADASSSGVLIVAMFFIMFFLFILVACVVYIVSMWKIYEKAGAPGWSVLIPLYNNVKLLEITRKPLWWILLLFIPIVNIVLLIIMTRRLAAVFGKGVGFTWGLVLLPFIFYPILAFGKSEYSNTFPLPAPMSEAVKWTLIAGFLLLLIEIYSSNLTSRLLDVAGTSTGTGTGTHSSMLVPFSDSYAYAADDTYVYYQDFPIYGADPKSFKIMGNYGVDAKSVYYRDQAIRDANPSTFKVLDDGGYAISGNTVYYDGAVVEGADAATFEDATDPSQNSAYDAKDAKNYYEFGNIVTP